MRRAGILVAAVMVALAIAVGFWAFGRASVEATSTVDPDVAIACAASTGTDEGACGAWADEILAAGPPSTTFELKDLARLELSRTLLGFGAECEAAYFLGRYLDSPVWTEPVPCPDEG